MNTLILACIAMVVGEVFHRIHVHAPIPTGVTEQAKYVWLVQNKGAYRFWANVRNVAIGIFVARMALHYTGAYSLYMQAGDVP